MDSAWTILQAASALAEGLDRNGRLELFRADETGLTPVHEDGGSAVLAWHPGLGWECRLRSGDPRAELLELYLPLCSATAAHPIAIGHLGQSLDGFIATPSGDSQTVTGN
jgi:diaminohydroxyphosphoribosylaminopyrimidine deaminase/5-amino-6-(5-phosphoribosylamino)uracil reductase